MIISKNYIYLNNLALCYTELYYPGLQRDEAAKQKGNKGGNKGKKGKRGKRQEGFVANRKDTEVFYCWNESAFSDGNLSDVNAPFAHLHNPHGPSHTECTIPMAPLAPTSRPHSPHLHSFHDFSQHNLMACTAPHDPSHPICTATLNPLAPP